MMLALTTANFESSRGLTEARKSSKSVLDPKESIRPFKSMAGASSMVKSGAYLETAEVVTACSWNQLVLCSDMPVVIEFWASWCGPCRMVSRVLDEIARDYSGRIKCLKIDTDEYPQVADTHGIQRIPTVLLFKNAEQVKSITGTLPKSVYVTAIAELLAE